MWWISQPLLDGAESRDVWISTQVEKADIKIDNPAAEAQDNTQELLDQIAAGTFQVSAKWRGADGETPSADSGEAGAAPSAWKAGGLRGGALSATGGKYVPPSMRGGGRGMSMDDNRDTGTLTTRAVFKPGELGGDFVGGELLHLISLRNMHEVRTVLLYEPSFSATLCFFGRSDLFLGGSGKPL